MTRSIPQISYLVRDYDEAIQYFTQSLDFSLTVDLDLGDGKRWVIVHPPNSSGCGLLLARASSPEQEKCIGNQTGGRVFLFMHTDDFYRDYELFKSRGIHFIESPREEEYGKVAVFEDMYGTKWDLIQPN
jgi:lactoylglutathione lyase